MGAPGRYTRICEDCGVVMENVGATRRFCPACLPKLAVMPTCRTYGQQVEFERRQKELRDRGEI